MTGPSHHTIRDPYGYSDGLSASGVVARRTADAYRMAIRSLQGALRPGDDTDLHEEDIEQILTSYLDATAGRFTRRAINTYVGNIRRIVGPFTGSTPAQREATPPAPATPPTTLGYTIQPRPGQVVHFRLPADLTAAEAQRLAAFITTLPIESQDTTGTSGEPS